MGGNDIQMSFVLYSCLGESLGSLIAGHFDLVSFKRIAYARIDTEVNLAVKRRETDSS